MAQLTEKQLEDKLRFAGETIPSMTRRRDGHDYEARQMYLITITVEGRRPLLGRVVGNPEAEEGAAEAPRIELSPLGKAVEQDWMAISHYHPEVEVIALQIMPDHLHSILFVKERMPQHLGHVIKGFKASTNKAYRRLIEPGTTVHSAATLSQPTGNTACSTEGPASPRTKPDRKHGLLWSIGYTDGILGRKGQLDNWLVCAMVLSVQIVFANVQISFHPLGLNFVNKGYSYQ